MNLIKREFYIKFCISQQAAVALFGLGIAMMVHAETAETKTAKVVAKPSNDSKDEKLQQEEVNFYRALGKLFLKIICLKVYATLKTFLCYFM